jgi:hypothetical protein
MNECESTVFWHDHTASSGKRRTLRGEILLPVAPLPAPLIGTNSDIAAPSLRDYHEPVEPSREITRLVPCRANQRSDGLMPPSKIRLSEPWESAMTSRPYRRPCELPCGALGRGAQGSADRGARSHHADNCRRGHIVGLVDADCIVHFDRDGIGSHYPPPVRAQGADEIDAAGPLWRLSTVKHPRNRSGDLRARAAELAVATLVFGRHWIQDAALEPAT